MHPAIVSVTHRIIERSRRSRQLYLQHMKSQLQAGPMRKQLSCGNLAHGFAACQSEDKQTLRLMQSANIAIVSAYNDMLSAHQPYAGYPDQIKQAAQRMGCTAQVAGGVPAMCDGVTQGMPGMELSLISRDVIAMSTAISLSHNMFDAGILLGVCDKIVPGLLMGALSFGHLPFLFVPAGPMPSGLPNKEKARIRQRYAEGKASREELLECEAQSYHSAGTCTFYGTANSNQMLLEVMGLHLPGAAFVPPNTPLRSALTERATEHICRQTALSNHYRPLYELVTEKSLVNALVALLATGGSTNHTMHWVAVARAAGILINWDDFAELSAAVPLLCRIYPNGSADINHFHAAGGTPLLIQSMLNAGLLHEQVSSVMGTGLSAYCQEPFLEAGRLAWRPAPIASADPTVLANPTTPFAPEGGLKVLSGNLGRGVIKVSAVAPEHQIVEAPAVVINHQDELLALFEQGALERDCVVVVRFQGPRANGMPELHQLTTYLGVLQDRGFKVALVTDGRMSGASGKVPAAIHVYPEAASLGPLAKLQNGDRIRLDAPSNTLSLLLTTQEEQDEWNRRMAMTNPNQAQHHGMGRELFTTLRINALTAEEGAITLGLPDYR